MTIKLCWRSFLAYESIKDENFFVVFCFKIYLSCELCQGKFKFPFISFSICFFSLLFILPISLHSFHYIERRNIEDKNETGDEMNSTSLPRVNKKLFRCFIHCWSSSSSFHLFFLFYTFFFRWIEMLISRHE